jgi:hypothetical protein
MPLIREGVVQVFTFKTGVLSRVAHDLRLSLGEFEIDVAGDQVRGRFWPDSLQVDGVMREDTLDAAGLGPHEKAEIIQNVRSKVLHTQQYPEVRLEARLSRASRTYRVTGELELVGKRRPITCSAAEENGRVRGEVELQPLRWDIPPFKALLGAIKLQDRVIVRFDLPVIADS